MTDELLRKRAIEIAAGCWCTPKTSGTPMDSELCLVFVDAMLQFAAEQRAEADAPEAIHSDHPSRVWDRTCPACVAEADKVWPVEWPLAWITNESLRRLRLGWDGSRGTVPVHSDSSIVAKIPLYAHPPSGGTVPVDPTHEMLKALCGDPIILSASLEEAAREAYKAMLAKVE